MLEALFWISLSHFEKSILTHIYFWKSIFFTSTTRGPKIVISVPWVLSQLKMTNNHRAYFLLHVKAHLLSLDSLNPHSLLSQDSTPQS